ncbi:MAG: Bug family tripartite tricarboxylate transporter substrate binding protein, partial [Clostridia bacterium]
TFKDFTDISPLAIQPNVLTVRPDGPYKTVADLVKAAKAKPCALNIGNAGIGSGTHLTTERFIAATGIKVVQIPFKGTPEVITAMFSGNVDAYWAPISAAMGSIKSDKLRPLAVSTAKRNPILPNVPTPAEAGIKGTESPLWFGLWGPAKMDPALVKKINADVRKALADTQTKARLFTTGNEVMEMSPEQFSKLVRDETEANRKILAAAGVKPQ